MSLGPLLISFNHYFYSLLNKKEYDVKFSYALCKFATSYLLIFMHGQDTIRYPSIKIYLIREIIMVLIIVALYIRLRYKEIFDLTKIK